MDTMIPAKARNAALTQTRYVAYYGALHVRRWSPMKSEEVPALVKELRQRLVLTQEQFAQHVGVTYSTVNHWENGKRVPLPFLAKRLVEMKRELDEAERQRAEGGFPG